MQEVSSEVQHTVVSDFVAGGDETVRDACLRKICQYILVAVQTEADSKVTLHIPHAHSIKIKVRQT